MKNKDGLKNDTIYFILELFIFGWWASMALYLLFNGLK